MQTKTKKRVGVLRGGPGKNYMSSLKKGAEIIDLLSRKLGEKYRSIDILIDKDHVWHYNGIPISPSELINKIDIIWNTAHPSLSNILDAFSIPNIKIGSFFHTLENDREMLREHVKSMDLEMPRSILFSVYQEDFDGPIEKYPIRKAKEVFEKFSSPWIVKSFTEDSNMGIHLAKTFPELVNAIEDGVRHKKSILVEEFIAGKIASVHSVPGFRKEDVYTFPLGNAFGTFSFSEKEKLFNLARNLHKHIGTRHYLKSDFVLTSSGKIYLLQIEGTPDFKKDSHFSQVCESVGVNAHDVVEHILKQV